VLLVLGTIRLPPENLEAARGAMAQMIRASRDEPGCIDYAYAEDVLQPGLIRVTEIWQDQAVLDAHFASPHIAAWRAAWPDLGIGDRELTAYEVAAVRPA
jgi:quinol monooxygenase YgiN